MIVESSSDTGVIWITTAGIAIAAVGVLMVWSIGLTLYCQFVRRSKNLKGQNEKGLKQYQCLNHAVMNQEGSVHDDAMESSVDDQYAGLIKGKKNSAQYIYSSELEFKKQISEHPGVLPLQSCYSYIP